MKTQRHKDAEPQPKERGCVHRTTRSINERKLCTCNCCDWRPHTVALREILREKTRCPRIGLQSALCGFAFIFGSIATSGAQITRLQLAARAKSRLPPTDSRPRKPNPTAPPAWNSNSRRTNHCREEGRVLLINIGSHDEVIKQHNRRREILALVPVATNTGHWKNYVCGRATGVCFLYDTRLRFLVGGRDDVVRDGVLGKKLQPLP